MTTRAVRTFVWILAFAGCASPVSPTGAEAASTSSPEAVQLIALTNVERSHAGLTALAASATLMRAAQIQAEQMASLGQMAHSLPGARYPEPPDRLAAVGYQWSAYAENVAYGQSTPAAVLGAWMGSSGHRANILNAGLIELGTGFATDAAGRPYWVQVFGHPR